MTSLTKKSLFFILCAAAGLAIAILFDYLDGGIQFTLN